jgi:pimeloyl-ACP methyl ester carboxylesterase
VTTAWRIASLLLAVAPAAAPAAAQSPAARSETVTYLNPGDGRPLTATLTLPAGAGPFPAAVVTTLAGADELIDALSQRGWAVLLPERRGIQTIEQLLRASFEDLALDVEAAAAYLRTRPEIDPAVVGLLSQGGETMAAVLAADASPPFAFVILMSTTGLPGDETFRIEQHVIGQDRNYSADAMAALDAFVLELTRLVVAEPSPGLRAFQVRALIGETEVELPRNAAFPPNLEDQVRFFASLWWRELFLFQPEQALARIRAPVLVLMGTDDPLVPYDAQLPGIERGLAAAPTEDALVCLLPGRLQHGITEQSLSVIERWLGDRLTPAGFVARPREPFAECVDLTRSRE